MNMMKPVSWLLDDCQFIERTSNGDLTLNICELVGNLAYHAMMLEAHLTPKPGLVDCQSNGAHKDMDINTFILSSEALRPYMIRFVNVGYEACDKESKDLLTSLRMVGIDAENAMYEATKGVNTHKGMIFTLGLICGAVGWLYRQKRSILASSVRQVIRDCCSRLVEEELASTSKIPVTAGERLYNKYGLTGIRGEAAAGYPTIFDHGLPVFENCVSKGESQEQALSKALLAMMSINCDSNLVHRGGMHGLIYVQREAKRIFATTENTIESWEDEIFKFDLALIDYNLSPGGSADLLAATWLLAQLNVINRA